MASPHKKRLLDSRVTFYKRRSGLKAHQTLPLAVVSIYAHTPEFTVSPLRHWHVCTVLRFGAENLLNSYFRMQIHVHVLSKVA